MGGATADTSSASAPADAPDDLFRAARAAMHKCHAPYSKFPVGAAIRDDEGNIHCGANIEVISFPEGWCAETTAIAHMIMAGGRHIAEVAVIAEKLPLCSPCGGCRQRLAEFAAAETLVHLCDHEGVKKTLTMADLLPLAFATEAIG
ncbi:cytidine deaminase [Pseudohoeflea coraliihabitans]|uniref:Cytidine deaminase n=1 Tax=Pseudohoeflea coraliihabitans TaxID=2860393 RepID=A0ABS6WRX9_9HYPH|nr:cytidine deaminase [Pseudohoeflea sp. DP4N28-3]MBW3097799.1 cytidine deaminase [Pseudohoeflea sp. DP4N28-3]